MAVRGEIVVECDTPTCHAELVVPADRLWETGVEDAAFVAEWKWCIGNRNICPDCFAEGKR